MLSRNRSRTNYVQTFATPNKTIYGKNSKWKKSLNKNTDVEIIQIRNALSRGFYHQLLPLSIQRIL